MTRTIARKTYRNGNWGDQSAGLHFDDGLMTDGRRISRPIWVVSAWDRWAHNTLAEAKAHYRRIGAARLAA